MENLSISQTEYTPSILMDYETNTVSIKGKSYPENTIEFYEPMIDWLKEYAKKDQKEKLTINIELIYFNSSSSKSFFDFFDLVENIKSEGKQIDINWIYDGENESALESGEGFRDDFEELDFNLIEKEKFI